MSDGKERVIAGLRELHGELHARLIRSRAEGNRLRHKLKAIESVIRLIRPDENMRDLVVKRAYRPNPIFKRGDITKMMMDTIRTAGKPLSAGEIARILLEKKGVVSPSKKQIATLQVTIITALNHYQGSAIVGDHARPQRWKAV